MYFLLLDFFFPTRIYSWKQDIIGRLESSSSFCCSSSSLNISQELRMVLGFLNLTPAKIPPKIHLSRNMCTCPSTHCSQTCVFQPPKIKHLGKIELSSPFDKHERCHLTTCRNSTAKEHFCAGWKIKGMQKHGHFLFPLL